jgi:hypothetical protein
MTPLVKTSNVSQWEMATCPACKADFKFYRSDQPHIDECGFESYSLRCSSCEVPLIGIIDPADDRLLLTDPSEGLSS